MFLLPRSNPAILMTSGADRNERFLVAARRCDNPRGCDYSARERHAMPKIDEDDRPKKKISHEIGQDLTLLSAEELRDRIALLHDEISRLEADIKSKLASRQSADKFFKT
jgi:uncharacterized small protein (DUF1192 family)